ncbi:hypothetical protein A3D07_01385 [Candidatus Curtissbacteria bacterium RIFCSPHIGHO2_02_FULL_42_15]|uniref:Uncharacterized protein n=1 Tax=Candidatus Curtissbacteria bacterium RIFCSPHIGHO2_02_FULL_42_15 TaxID=1797716 RepID=A0A1F5GHG3_9BACT|nr:MAG: hypothetical protein A3D07_01385 [Candidatus Curtissbacteria bacterium RIFCSPHIGHO2_02_FULL_42_15]
MFKALEKEKPTTIGLCQSLGVTVYCGLVALLFNFLTKAIPSGPGFFGFFFMLILLVFSAAITGTMVFGYPAYLALVKNKIKEALTILAFTLLYSLVIIFITAIFIISLA